MVFGWVSDSAITLIENVSGWLEGLTLFPLLTEDITPQQQHSSFFYKQRRIYFLTLRS